MRNRYRLSEAARLASERRQREDEAPRLRFEVRQLVELAIEIDEYSAGGAILAARHTRRIVVNHAPALFEFPCTEQRCKGGGFNPTSGILRALKLQRAQFDGEDACAGQVGSGPCGRILRYVVHATYADEAQGSDGAQAEARRRAARA